MTARESANQHHLVLAEIQRQAEKSKNDVGTKEKASGVPAWRAVNKRKLEAD